MKEFIEEIWRKGKKIYNHKWRKLKSLQASHLNPKLPQCSSSSSSSKMCPRDVPIRVFPASLENIQLSLFICWEKGQNAQLRVVLASRSPVGEPLARLQRRHAAGLPVGFVKMHWLASGSPVGEPLASRPWFRIFSFPLLLFLLCCITWVSSSYYHLSTSSYTS